MLRASTETDRISFLAKKTRGYFEQSSARTSENTSVCSYMFGCVRRVIQISVGHRYSRVGKELILVYGDPSKYLENGCSNRENTGILTQIPYPCLYEAVSPFCWVQHLFLFHFGCLFVRRDTGIFFFAQTNERAQFWL